MISSAISIKTNIKLMTFFSIILVGIQGIPMYKNQILDTENKLCKLYLKQLEKL